MNNGRMIIGFTLGALAGAALSCFAHSNRGQKMRKDLYQAIKDLKAKGSCCNACECGEKCECGHTCESMEETLK